VSISNHYTLDFRDSKAVLATAGGKGASLVQLTCANLPVPAGFIITTDGYRCLVNANGLQPLILQALANVDAGRQAGFEEAARCIQAYFLAAPLPVQVETAVAQAYGALPGENPAVAVRSSATAEDLPQASFAGQHESYLNVSGRDALLEAVRKCWASLWTARAIGYRLRQGIPPTAVEQAVVVQLLVSADVAGILFTAHPVTGQRDQVVISAAWGLGEAVVSGLVTADSITVEKETGRVVERVTADKQVMTVRAASGTKQCPVPEHLRPVPVLSDREAADLTRPCRMKR
jgi:rifampicin phosphotransferase